MYLLCEGRHEALRLLGLWRKDHCYENSIFAYSFDDGALTIFSDRPGWLIGYHGKTIKNYTSLLKEACPDIKSVKIKEVVVP